MLMLLKFSRSTMGQMWTSNIVWERWNKRSSRGWH